MANIKRLKRLCTVLGYLTLFPENHSQRHWFEIAFGDKETIPVSEVKTMCNSTLCFAGHTTSLYAPKGSMFAVEDQDLVFIPDSSGEYTIHPETGQFLKDEDYCWDEAPASKAQRYRSEEIFNFAAKRLGLTDGQAMYMFCYGRSVPELIAAIRIIIKDPEIGSADLSKSVETALRK